MKRPNQIRVFLADDHAVLRAGLKMLLNAQDDMTVVGEAADGREACDRAPVLSPDAILLDVSMPGLSGLETARRLRKLLPEAKLVVLTQHDDEGYLGAFLEAGCSGYVLKKSADHELASAIRSAAAGNIFVCPSMSKALADRYVLKATGQGDPPARRPDKLSQRECEVVSLVAQGYTNIEIAETLSISVKTVETHKRRIMGKLGFSRRAQLVRYAGEHGLMEERMTPAGLPQGNP